jgi:hypothetical protein
MLSSIPERGGDMRLPVEPHYYLPIPPYRAKNVLMYRIKAFSSTFPSNG